ncbi:MAG: hypothetical protein R3C10_20055 [Pirellulales bacterium]
MQTEVFTALSKTASPQLRRRLAEYMLSGDAAESAKQAITQMVMANQPSNLGAQIALFGSPTTDAETRSRLLGYFTEYGKSTIQNLLGIPEAFRVADVPGSPPAPGGFNQGFGGDYGGPGTPAYGFQDTASAQGASQEARDRIAGAPVPQANDGLEGLGPVDGGYGDNGYGNGGYGNSGYGGGSGLPVAAEPSNPLLYYQVAGYLWRNEFVDTLKLDSLEKAAVTDGAQVLRLAATMPLDAVRRQMAKLVNENWEMGAERMRSSPGPWGQDLLDPGALVIVKAQPRKMDPEVRRWRQSGGEDDKHNSQGGPGRPQPPKRSAPRNDDEREDYARYEWMEASEQFIRVWNQRFLAAARAGHQGKVGRFAPENDGAATPFQLAAARVNQADAAADGDAAAADPFGTKAAKAAAAAVNKLPLQLHEGAKIVAEYHLNWPTDLEGKMPGADEVSPLIVHYVRIEEENRMTTLGSFYSGQMKGSRGNFLPDGRWLDFSDDGSAPGRKRTIDVMFTTPDYTEPAPAIAGPPQEGEETKKRKSPSAVQDLVIEILSVEIDDPAAAEGA